MRKIKYIQREVADLTETNHFISLASEMTLRKPTVIDESCIMTRACYPRQGTVPVPYSPAREGRMFSPGEGACSLRVEEFEFEFDSGGQERFALCRCLSRALAWASSRVELLSLGLSLSRVAALNISLCVCFLCSSKRRPIGPLGLFAAFVRAYETSVSVFISLCF